MTEETKRTRGPWRAISLVLGTTVERARESTDLEILVVLGPDLNANDGQIISQCGKGKPEELTDEQRANQEFIANAPRIEAERDSLLAAWENLLSHLDSFAGSFHPPEINRSIDRGRAAVAECQDASEK